MLTLKEIAEIYEKHKEEYNTQIEKINIGNKEFDFKDGAALMGVINLSVDSWWHHSICYTPEQAIRRGRLLIAKGADIVDIGAEATAKNTTRVDELKQTSQLLPVLQTLSQEGILTSVETYYPEVARECLISGANVINFTGIENSEEMYKAVADFDATVIICYVQGKHARDVEEFDLTKDKDPIILVYDYFAREIEKATQLGVKKIFIDPALALGYSNFYSQYENAQKRLKYQIESLLNAFRLRKLGFPVFNQVPSALEIGGEEIRSTQLFISVFAALGKTDMLRTHEIAKVKAMLETLALI
ncbi:dihydropteroate synthase [Roseofilum sp. Guam]|uniref:dihydropteroate synthase n=1 Tax=Roseofilum sp. Guam TaxID=2821502 RepID=UPI001B244F65|nr:dihydropteroate synthase [Roseofilum sp. Guam]MBP0028155.1 dihydropteroate synthase [Roseofilum sp. Guam]